jgi:dihydroorotase
MFHRNSPPRVVPGKVAYVNARLMDPASGLDVVCGTDGGLLTDGETISAYGPGIFASGLPEGCTQIDCGGAILAPGLVDMRMQLREPGEAHKESVKSAGKAAVAGGITAMVTLPNTTPALDDEATIEFIARRARQIGLAKVYCYATTTKGAKGKELSEMGMLSRAGAVAFTDGDHAVADVQTMRRALQYAATFGALIIQHPEEPGLAGGVMNSGDIATRLGLSGIPREAEIIMLERDMRLVEMTGGRYHAAHISTSESVEIIRRAKAKGLDVTCDTAPPYFALNELAVGDYRTFSKLSPPLRAESDRQAIIAGLVDGTIDAIASDHAPQDSDAKRLPFAQAAFGGIGLETLLPVTLELVHNGLLDLMTALRLLTSGPADLLALSDHHGQRSGRLAVGGAADLVVFDLEKPWKFVADKSLSKSKNSPFDGRLLQGRTLRTVVDGRTVYGEGAA